MSSVCQQRVPHFCTPCTLVGFSVFTLDPCGNPVDPCLVLLCGPQAVFLNSGTERQSFCGNHGLLTLDMGLIK